MGYRMTALVLFGAAVLGFGGLRQEPADAAEILARTFAEEGVHLDLESGVVSLRTTVLVRNELLEYLLVGPLGQAHESLFFSEVTPSVLNAALLALGVEPGTNARWIPVEPAPTLEERRAGKSPYDVVPPAGDGFYLYVAWREAGETYFYRAEDLLANLETGRSMRRHRWVYLGSRFVRYDGQEVYAADVEQNLINVAFFSEGHTLATAALPECVDQAIWIANVWLIPPRESAVELIFAREKLASVPASVAERLPTVGGDGKEDR